jgi:hypothetical protein
MSLIRTVDHFLYRAITRDLRNEHIERYVRHLAVDHDETIVPNVIGRGFQIIDSKASGLLIHTSMMIAALGISAPVVAKDYFRAGRDRGGDHVLSDGRARLLALPFHVSRGSGKARQRSGARRAYFAPQALQTMQSRGHFADAAGSAEPASALPLCSRQGTST